MPIREYLSSIYVIPGLPLFGGIGWLVGICCGILFEKADRAYKEDHKEESHERR